MPSATPSGANRESLLAVLAVEARRRFGGPRAEALAADLEALATDLARVAEATVPSGSEPAFFLLRD